MEHVSTDLVSLDKKKKRKKLDPIANIFMSSDEIGKLSYQALNENASLGH